MTELDKYKKVNQCETLEELANVIESFANEDGLIKGRTKDFNAELMAGFCRYFKPNMHNLLTREFGIRQQALYILFYDKKIDY